MKVGHGGVVVEVVAVEGLVVMLAVGVVAVVRRTRGSLRRCQL